MAKLVVLALTLCLSLFAEKTPRRNGTYRATAYCQTGVTKSGEWTKRHLVAADPDVLPIGTRIKIRRAGRYSGEYVVADTGSKVKGRHLDIYMPSENSCKLFGSKKIKVKVLALGDGSRESVKDSKEVVDENVAKDIKNKAVGNSATQEDWAKSKTAKKAIAQASEANSPDSSPGKVQ